MTKTYRVGVAAERVVEVEAKNSHEAIGAALDQLGAEGRTILGTTRVERVKKAKKVLDDPKPFVAEHD